MKSLKEFIAEDKKFDVDYAVKIAASGNLDRLKHHIYDVDDSTLLAIRDELYKTPEYKKMFDTATKGMAPLKESEDIPDDVKKVAAELEELTDVNAHTEAGIELAKFLKEPKIQYALQSILANQDKLGYLPNHLNTTRSDLLKSLDKTLKAKYPKNIYDYIRKAL